MVTRFYFPSAGTAPASPAYSSVWDETADGYRAPLVTTPSNTTGVTRSANKALTTSPNDGLVGQWISDVLPAGSVAGTFTLVVGAAESTGSRNAFLQAVIRVVSGDGATVRGTLYAGQTATAASATTSDSAYEFALFSVKSRVLTASLSSVVALAGDRIVVEYGARAINANTYTSSVTITAGDETADVDASTTVDTDASSSNTRPWIEFSQDLFTGGPAAGSVSLAGTRQAKTAAFAVATVVAASLAGTVPAKIGTFELSASAQVALAGTVRAKTSAFVVDLPAAPDRVVSLAGQKQARNSAFALLASESVALAGQRQAKTAAFALSTLALPAQVGLAGQVQAKVGAFEVSTADRTFSLAGVRRARTSTIALSGSPVLRLDGTARHKTAAFTASALSTVSIAGTVQGKVATFTTRAVVPVTPAPAVATAAQSYVTAQAFGPVTMVGAQPVYSASEARTPRARQQIVVDGVDFTYLRDVVTPDVTYTLLEPLLYGPGNLTLPQVSACFERPGYGDLTPLRPGAVVEVHRVIDDAVVDTDYKGVIVGFDLSGRDLSVELGGEASGRAALRNRQAVIFPRINDLGHQMADTVSDLGLPFAPRFGPVTGIEAMTFGGMGHLDHIQQLVAKAWTRGGGHWTVMPDEATGVYEAHQKDETTIHATAFIDDARTVANLRRDIAEEPNRIYATGVTPQGQRVRFGVYPGLKQGPTPDYPGLLVNGDTGEGVRLLIGKLHAVGYLRLFEVSGGFDVDVVEAVKDLQDDAGLPKTGEVDIVTWQALYDLNITGTSLEAAHIEPAAQRSVVRRWDRSASGQIMGYNDDYEPERLPRDRNVDMGVGLNRSQMRRFARATLYDSNDPNWVGDIEFRTGALLRGNVAAGATVTEADVMDSRELRPGMNVWLPLFDGGTLVHVAACEVGDTVKASVDTRFRDAMEVWEVIARNKESRNDPARKRNRAHRSSTIAKDSIGEWDEIGGQLGHDVTLDAGWNVFEVVAAMEGTIGRLRIELANPAEFAVAVFGRTVDRGFLDDVIGNPLTDAGVKAWEKKGDTLEDRWLLYSAGTRDEPCGYWPGRKKWLSTTGEEPNPEYAPDADADTTGTDDDEFISVTTEESSGTLTGKHKDDAGFAYRSWDRTKLYVAVYARNPNTIPLGRIMWPQLEAGV